MLAIAALTFFSTVRCVSMMMSTWSSPSRGSFWNMASIEISRSAQDARDVGEHAGPVDDAHAQVVRGLDLAHRQDRRVGELVGLEREVRHAMLRDRR